MTTIAYKDGMLAADTACCQGGVLCGSIVKIVRRDDGDMAGAAGDASYNFAFTTWFLAGEQGAPPEAKEEDRSFDRGVIYRRSGTIDVFEPRGKFAMNAPFYAFGSGKEPALGAMFAGADAETAIEAAIQFDPHTGGEITVLRHEG
jgi:ATP-dependent HslUV protease subunit HslV